MSRTKHTNAKRNAARRAAPPEPVAALASWPHGGSSERLTALAGHPFEIEASRFARGEVAGEVRWRAGGNEYAGPTLRWTPPSPGHYRIVLQAGKHYLWRRLTVGLRPADLLRRHEQLRYYFCLVIQNGHKVHFLPLVPPNGKAGRKPSALKKEVAAGHPAFARLMAAHTRIYRRRVLPHPYLEARAVPTGLYAICSNDMVYLGGAPAVRKAVAAARESLDLLHHRSRGRGAALAGLERAAAELKPWALQYQDEARFPVDSAKRRGAFAPERFACGVVSSVVRAATEFARDLGTDLGAGAGLTSLITFNSANGALSTSLFDVLSGVSRQVMSGFETEAGMGLDGGIGRGSGIGSGSGMGGGSGMGSGGGVRHGDLGGGVSSFGRMGSSAAMDGEGGDGIPGGGYDSGGLYWVQGDDGSTVGFGYGPDGNPAPSAVDTSGGGEVWYGDVTVWDFGDDGDVITGSPGGSGGGTGGGDTGGGTGGGDTGGGTGGGDTGGGDTGGGTDGGTGGGDAGGGDTPPGTSPDEMPAPDDGGGGGGPDDGGSGGGGGAPPRGSPTRNGGGDPLGVLTVGGGFTDPAPGEEGGGGAGGGILVVPGGGVTDPAPDSDGSGGFVDLGGFNPPVSGAVDPIDPLMGMAGDYASEGAGNVGRLTTLHGGVRLNAFAGTTASGLRLDGLLSGAVASPPSGGDLIPSQAGPI